MITYKNLKQRVVALVAALRPHISDYIEFVGYDIEDAVETVIIRFNGSQVTETFGLFIRLEDNVYGEGGIRLVNKISLSGLFPTAHNSRQTMFFNFLEDETIGLSLDRDIDKVVKDIVRRFWPVYVRKHKHACALKLKDINYANRCAKARADLDAAFPGYFWPMKDTHLKDPCRPANTSASKFTDLYMSVPSGDEPITYEVTVRVSSLEALKKISELSAKPY
jgi:hypothetical protein